MVDLRTLVLAFSLLLAPPPAPAQEAIAIDPLIAFATCAGRLSAEMRHQWLISDPDATQTEARREAMIDLLEAVVPEGSGVHAMHHRMAARQAHAALLTRATFNRDRRDAAWARKRADAEISGCLKLVLY